LRALDRLIAGEKHIPLLGASSPIDQTRHIGIFGLLGGARGPFLATVAMVMWVLLAIGHWPLAVGRSVLSLARILQLGSIFLQESSGFLHFPFLWRFFTGITIPVPLYLFQNVIRKPVCMGPM
jgi:hypothetical protein